MNIKLIKTKKDYTQALKAVEKLWDAKPNTKAGDRLEVLVTLIEKYEAKKFPINAPNPAVLLEYLRESRSMMSKI